MQDYKNHLIEVIWYLKKKHKTEQAQTNRFAYKYLTQNYVEEYFSMAKRKVILTDEQKKKNAEILARLEAERQRLVEETRALQQQERRRPGRKRRKKMIEGLSPE